MTTQSPERNTPLLQQLANIARDAGELIMEVQAGKIDVEYKDDASPVTVADQRANDHIVKALKRLFPEIPIVSEEGAQAASSAKAPCFWLVDPLDGTKSFIRGEGEFTVNIGLIEGTTPVAGVIYVPAQNLMYLGSDQAGAFRINSNGEQQSIRVNTPEGNRRAVLVSKHHASPEVENILAPYEITEKVQASSSMKFCYVADGKADLYPRTGPTMEWDTAAGHAILLAAGGSMTMLDGSPFVYGKPEYRNPGFIASA